MAMSEEEKKKSIEREVKEMTEERYEEIREALHSLRLSKTEIFAWLEINKKLNAWGRDHKFAAKTT